MINISSVDLDAWINGLIFPLTRILAVISTAPLWSSAGVSRRIRLMLGIAITLALMPVLPPMPGVSAGSGAGLWIMGQQVLIGMGMGFAARVVYEAIDLAGNYISLQMGLGFATMYDPQSAAQTPVLSQFIGILSLLVFLALNGHLMYVSILVKSFQLVPVGAQVLAPETWLNLSLLGSRLFGLGLLLALPVLVALMLTNLVLAVLTRAAPQLNVFSVGFPITLTVGLAALLAGTQYLAAPLEHIFNITAESMLDFPVRAKKLD